MFSNTIKRSLLPVGLIVLAAGCSSEAEPDEELWDEGPTAADEKSDEGPIGQSTEALSSADFQLPFPCNQAWLGQTRTNHSPINSVDFNRAGDEGDTVVAAASGVVTRVENLGNRSYGRWIEISHGGGWTTRYAHLSAQSVSRGQRVARGQKIGNVGNTGGSSGAHLHYEQRLNGNAVRASFNGAGALYFGSRTYTSKNSCSSSGGGGGGGGGGGSNGRVDTSGGALTVRSGPGSNFAAVGSLPDNASVTIKCQKVGQSITGKFGTTNIWDNVGNGYVSDAYVFTGTDGRVAPDCK